MAADFPHLEPPQVLVAGAGFAGLSAAYALHKRGIRVKVIEARDRPGGRVCSRRLPNGPVAELGGEWISPQDTLLMALAGEFGVRLAPVGVNFFIRMSAEAGVDAARLAAAGRLAGEALASLAPEAVRAMSLGVFLESLPLDEAVRSVVCARLQGSAGARLEDVALASYAADHFGFYGEGPFYRLAGGNQSLAAALQARLPSIAFGYVLNKVEQDGSGVRLVCQTPEGPVSLRAGCAVLALPLPIMQALDFHPPLRSETAQALRGTPMGTAAKLVRAARTRPPLVAHQDLEVPFWSWTGLGLDGRTRPVVTAFCGSSHAVDKLDIGGGGPAAWSERLQAAHPEIEFEGRPLLADWPADPLAQGCYSAFDPRSWGQRAALRAANGRLFFAGEHTSDNFGTMEGALESGRRAAREVIDSFHLAASTRADGRTAREHSL